MHEAARICPVIIFFNTIDISSFLYKNVIGSFVLKTFEIISEFKKSLIKSLVQKILKAAIIFFIQS